LAIASDHGLRLLNSGASVNIGAPTPLFSVAIDESTTHSTRNHYVVTSDGQRFLIISVANGPHLNVLVNWQSALSRKLATPR